MKLKYIMTVAILLMLALCEICSAQANVPTYGQRWSPWSTDRLGWGPSYVTIGSDGCVVTSLASVRTYYGDFQTPRTMNNYLKSHGGFSGSLVIWGRVPGFRSLRDYTYVPADLNYINWCLDHGWLVVAKTYFAPNRTVPHWVLITGHSGYVYTIMDPWFGDKTTFNARYGSPARWIYRIAAFGP